MPKLDAYGIGNSLVDYVVSVTENDLARFDLRKGVMHLIDERRFVDIMNHLNGRKVTMRPGGSASNTMIGMARLGASVALTGKIGVDFHGSDYVRKLGAAGVTSNVVAEEGITGTCVCMVTKDNERTMTTCLANSARMLPSDVGWLALKHARILHIEGYMLTSENQKATIMKAMQFAKANGITISFDLADPFIVKRYLKDMKLIIKNYADIIFLNEAEAKEYCGATGKAALKKIGTAKQTVALKMGKKGSLVRKGKEIVKIPIRKVKAIDTTGAGDLYAAGFLYGVSQHAELKTCGYYASFLASEIVSIYGAYLPRVKTKELTAWLKKA